ncbi:MAG: hypothetical protein QF657_03490 [Candidatus Nitrosopelagicus sp.]|nr:hypothetical protein [Candidatus Nitrosopelagicus sp.]MDP6899095.1 hypothetical protein [Candidatus Nitrosopelagicus sp.]
MKKFSKKCSVCSEEFFDIVSFMSHIKGKHGDLSPEQLRDIGQQKKPSLKSE